MKPQIVSFWHGKDPGPLAQMCLASQVKAGHRVTIFSYAPLRGLPPNVENEDAECILPIATMDRLRYVRTKHPALRRLLHFSDLFRLRLQLLGRGLWLDTDVYLKGELSIDPGQPYWAWESSKFIGNAVCYLPKMHPAVIDYERLHETADLMPDWLPLRLRARHALWNVLGLQHTASDLNLLMYGPMALTQLAKRHGCLASVMNRTTFYAYGQDFYTHRSFERVAKIVEDPAVLGIHVRTHEFAGEPPKPGTLHEWAYRNVAAFC